VSGQKHALFIYHPKYNSVNSFFSDYMILLFLPKVRRTQFPLSIMFISRILGSHGAEYDNGCLLGCNAMCSGGSLPALQRRLLPPSSGQ
jgi:hypothetical protein